MATSERTSQRSFSPFSAEWRETELAALAARAEAGEDQDDLRSELLQRLWPWAQRLADREARKLPVGSDADDTRSHLLTAVWQATRQIDWDRWDTWPALLLRRVRGARVDAARNDDVVSRRDRLVLNRVEAEVAACERQRGASLSSNEREAIRQRIFSELAPRRRRALSNAVTTPPVLVDTFATDVADERWDPEALAVAADRAESLDVWLHHDVPPELRARLLEWFARDTRGGAVPVRLRDQLLPYLPSLVERVEERDRSRLACAG